MFPYHFKNTISFKIVFGVSFAALVIGILYFFLSCDDRAPAPEKPAYINAELPIDSRVSNLLSYMTLKEKIGQMTLVEKNSVLNMKDVSRYGLGGILSGFGGKPEENTSEGWKEMVKSFITESERSRLAIPALYGADAIHGHSNVPGATIFPHFIGLGASGATELVRAVAVATKEELRATGISWSFSPTYDMPTDIRWGRTYEAFSDDPALVSRLGAAYISGLQTSAADNEVMEVLATPKHYVGAGSMLWDSSSNENFSLDQGVTVASEEKLRKLYLPPFKKAIDAGALSIMVGLNSWDNTKLAADSYLIQDVLKGDLDFKGFVVSDWYGVYEIPGGDYQAAVTAINAGVDMVMLPFDYKVFIKNVTLAVERGDITEERIDDAVGRILTAKFALGMFNKKTPAPPVTTIGSKEHRKLAREAVAKSLVLLKNNGKVLPIKNKNTTIRVAGSAANNIGRQSGAWTVEWQGIDGNWLLGATSILKGLTEGAGDGMKIEFNEHAEFSTHTPKANIGIAIVGESPYAEGWGDNPNPELTKEDLETIERLEAVSEKVVIVLISGRPLIITNHIKNWDTVVAAWLPGSEGAGVADVIFGKRPFTGKLPLPWPAHINQLPIAADGSTQNGTQVLFPRYFGLQ